MAGCERLCQEVASCVKKVRLALGEMLGKLRADDGLLTWKLERMGRSLKPLVFLKSWLHAMLARQRPMPT